jgi:YidC/Oxa1 family membrane protein insertase
MSNYTPPGQMHPQDMKNMMLFAVLAVAVFLLFDQYVLKAKIAGKHDQVVSATRASTKDAEEIQPLATVLAETQRITIDTPQLQGSMPVTGGRIDDIVLKNYKVEEGKPDGIRLLSPPQTDFPYYVESGWISESATGLPDKNTVWQLASASNLTGLTPTSPVTLIYDNGAGLAFARKYTVDKNFLVTVTQSVTNNSDKAVDLAPYTAIAHRGLPATKEASAVAHVGPVIYAGDELLEVPYKKMDKQGERTLEGATGWAGITDKYWLVSILPEQQDAKIFRMVYSAPKTPGARALYQTDVTEKAFEVAPGKSIEITTNLFIGAKQAGMLQDYAKQLQVHNFDLAVDFGMLFFLTKPFYWLLSHFYHWIGNFGVAILLLTVMIRVAIFPLANTSFKAFAMMKKVAPQMAEIREKYGADKTQMQQEIIKLYEREKVNPMAGCLPLLVQIPIFFAMYKVIYITIEMRHAPFFGWITDLSAPDPTTLFNLFGLIPWTPPSFLPMIGIWPCLMLIFLLVQQKLHPPPPDSTQRAMMMYMPYFMTFILAGFPAGLVVYWTFSNCLSVFQQMLIMRMMGVPIHLFGETDEAQEAKRLRKEKQAERAGKATLLPPKVKREKAEPRKADDVPPEDTLFGGKK